MLQAPEKDFCFSQQQLQRMHGAMLDLGLSPLSFGVARVTRDVLPDWYQQPTQLQDTTRVYVHLTVQQQIRLKAERSELLNAAVADEAAEVAMRACDFKGAPT